MAKGRQQINIRSPWTDAVDCGQRGVRFIGGHVAEPAQRKFAAPDGACDLLERADFWRGKAEPRQPGWPGAPDRFAVERRERGIETPPDSACARGRELLGDDDGGKPGKAVGATPQRRPAGLLQQSGKSRIGPLQGGKRGVEIGFGVNMRWHRCDNVSRNLAGNLYSSTKLMD